MKPTSDASPAPHGANPQSSIDRSARGESARIGDSQATGQSPLSEQAERAQRLEALGRLAGGAAHDFNNVLGVILGYVELAKMGMKDPDPKVLRHLGLALSTLERARQLADHLLDFSREERRTADLCELGQAVQDVRGLLTATLDRRIVFDVTLAPEALLTPLDKDGLRQVVTNLCLNAADALPAGGTIFLETGRLEIGPGLPLRPGHYVVLTVRDSGSGVARNDRARIFEAGFTHRPETHSGMGLAVARGIAERFGGSLDLTDEGPGAVFTVRLPTDLRVGDAPAAAPSAPALGSKADVLIVDDEPGVRDVTRAFLESAGYRVLAAASAAEAQRVLAEHPGRIRVVLLDHVLSDGAGAELAWKLAGQPGCPQIVLMTGLAAAVGPQGLPSGTRVLEKPFLSAELARLLRDDLGIEPR